MVNAWLGASHPEEPPIARTALFADRRRAVELRRRDAPSDLDEYLAELEMLVSEAWTAFDEAKDTSLNRSAFLGIVRQAVSDRARVLGLDKADQPQAGGPVQVTIFTPSAEDVRVAMEVLGDRLPAPSQRVIDAPDVEEPREVPALPAPKRKPPAPKAPRTVIENGVEVEDFEPDALPPAPAPGVDDGWDHGFEPLRGGGGGGGMASRFADFRGGR